MSGQRLAPAEFYWIQDGADNSLKRTVVSNYTLTNLKVAIFKEIKSSFKLQVQKMTLTTTAAVVVLFKSHSAQMTAPKTT